jgi:hypothetical protein
LEQPNAFSTPYFIAAEFSATASTATQTNSSDAGLYLSDGSKVLGIECLRQLDSSGGTQLRVEHITLPSNDGGSVFGPQSFINSSQPQTTSCTEGAFYGAWVNDGSTLSAFVSPDGVIWNEIYSEAVGAFLTPTEYGWGGANVVGGGDLLIKLGGWQTGHSTTLP